MKTFRKNSKLWTRARCYSAWWNFLPEVESRGRLHSWCHKCRESEARPGAGLALQAWGAPHPAAAEGCPAQPRSGGQGRMLPYLVTRSCSWKQTTSKAQFYLFWPPKGPKNACIFPGQLSATGLPTPFSTGSRGLGHLHPLRSHRWRRLDELLGAYVYTRTLKHPRFWAQDVVSKS